MTKVHQFRLQCATFLALAVLFAGPAAAVNFTTSNGQIVDTHGNIWHGAGVGISDDYVFGNFNYTGHAALAAQMLATLPNINLVRIACYTQKPCYTDNNPASYEDFVRYLTDRGIVVVIEHHDATHTVLTGTALQQESNWYATLAAYYVNNPYVMFQTMNEPNAGDAAQMLATYNAIRNAGNNTVIFFEAGDWAGGWAGTQPQTVGSTSGFGSLHGVAWDLHTYDHVGVTYNEILSDQNSRINNLHAIHSADGVMPVISLEGGNSVDGMILDPGEVTQVDIDFTNPNLVGFAAWAWNIFSSCARADNITNYDVVSSPIGPRSVTSYGLQVANYIAMRGGNTSYNAATIPGSTKLIDASHTVWTISNGVIYLNGVADSRTSNVTLLLYYNSVIYQQNNTGGWWSYGNGQWTSIAGDPRPSSYPSGNGAVVVAGSGAALIDASRNMWAPGGGKYVSQTQTDWSICKNEVIDVASVINLRRLLFYNNAVYQQSDAGWRKYVNGTWSAVAGDPRPPPSGNGATVPTASQLIDGSRTLWTLSNGVIYINGAADATTHDVTLLLYYNSVIYQKNNTGGWWGYINGAWNSVAGDPRPAPSTSGSTIPNATQLVDASRTLWTVSGGVISMNGTADATTHDVTLLLYYNSAIYQRNNAGGWWKYVNGGWTSIAGDPRAG